MDILDLYDKFSEPVNLNSKHCVTVEDLTKEMKWGAFKKYCTSKGIKVSGKNRKKLEEELKGL